MSSTLPEAPQGQNELERFVWELSGLHADAEHALAYIDALHQIAKNHPDLLGTDPITFSDLYRFSQKALLLALSCALEESKQSGQSVNVVSVCNYACSNREQFTGLYSDKGVAEKADADADVCKLVMKWRDWHKNLVGKDTLKKVRDWQLAHLDKKLCLGKASIESLPYADIREMLAGLEELVKDFMERIHNSEFIMNNVFIDKAQEDLELLIAVYLVTKARLGGLDENFTEEVQLVRDDLRS